MDVGHFDWKAAQLNSSDLDVFLLGCVDFSSFLYVQDRLAAEVQSRNDRYGVLLLCEHPLLISLGRDGSLANLESTDESWEAPRCPVHWVGRGGGAWKHGPGQLNVSLMVPVERLNLSPVQFRQALVHGFLRTAIQQRVPAYESGDNPGVAGRTGQLAFVGAAIHAGVSQFGGIINVAPSYEVTAFSPSGQRNTSLAAERTRPVSMAAVRESLIRNFVEVLGYEQFQIHTGHPWLRRTTQTVPVHA